MSDHEQTGLKQKHLEVPPTVAAQLSPKESAEQWFLGNGRIADLVGHPEGGLEE